MFMQNEAKMFVILATTVIIKCLPVFASGALFVESIPRRIQENDRVTLKCFPTKFTYRRECQFQWTWKPGEDDQHHTGQQQKSDSASPWWKVVKQEDAAETGSVIIIDNIQAQHQGRYICQLTCYGRKTESAVINLDFGQDYSNEINSKNSDISYITVGVIFSLIIIVTILRFTCVNAQENCCRTKKTNRTHNINPNHLVHLQRLQNLSYCSTARVWNKPKLEPRPTVLSSTVWLPPYEAALKHTQIVNPTSTNRPSTSTCPPTYEEALSMMRKYENSDRIQTV